MKKLIIYIFFGLIVMKGLGFNPWEIDDFADVAIQKYENIFSDLGIDDFADVAIQKYENIFPNRDAESKLRTENKIDIHYKEKLIATLRYLLVDHLFMTWFIGSFVLMIIIISYNLKRWNWWGEVSTMQFLRSYFWSLTLLPLFAAILSIIAVVFIYIVIVLRIFSTLIDAPVPDEKPKIIQRITEEERGKAFQGIRHKRQNSFINIIYSHRLEYNAAKTEIQKSIVRKKRVEEFFNFFSGNLFFDSWVGEIKTINTDSEGTAELEIEMGNSRTPIEIQNGGYYGEGIEMDDVLYNNLSELQIGDTVFVSGHFSKTDNGDLNEYSFVEMGKMTSPEFAVIFTDIKRVNK
jgi:hypothetical protein